MKQSMKDYNFKHVLQSEWTVDLMKKYLPDVGFFVEIGVGHIVSWDTLRRNFENPEIGGSHTAELVNLGWSGIYIEPIEEFCREAMILFRNDLTRLRILNYGASDQYEVPTLYGQESLVPNGIVEYRDAFGNLYAYPNRKILCKPTSVLLSEVQCPKAIDFMIVDVEGYEGKVLRGIDFNQHRPKMLLIENNRFSDHEIIKIIPSNYRLIQRDNLNSCYIDNS